MTIGRPVQRVEQGLNLRFPPDQHWTEHLVHALIIRAGPPVFRWLAARDRPQPVWR